MPLTEIGFLYDAGMSIMEIITAATKNAAYVCGLEDETGTIEAGKRADFFVVSGNPLSDFEVLSNVVIVVREGYLTLP